MFRVGKYISLVAVIVFISVSLQAQVRVAPNKYWVAFKDKANSSYSIEKPEEFLSERAIQRREKYDIPINGLDIPVNENYIDSLLEHGLEVFYSSKWLNGVLVYTTDTNLIKEVSKFDFVIDFELKKDIIVKVEKELELPSEPIYKFAQLQGLTENVYDYGYGQNQIDMLNGVKLHNEGFDGKNILMAILDAGFYRVNQLSAFDSIWQNGQIKGVRDFVDIDTMVWDADSHGMKVLSTIASNLPGQFVGTAPKADFFLIRTEDAASENIIEEFNWVAGAELADSIGADIVHSSLGYSNFDDTTLSHTYADMNGDIAPSTIGADIAASKGMLVVVSAGNEGNDAWQYITAPGDADSVLTVGATDRYGDYAFFSSVGPTVDGRVKPNVTAQGLSATVIAINGDISTSSGTSFSGPIIAGMAASLWQARPELNNMALIKAMENNASQSVAPDSLLGYGLPDFYMAWMYPTAIETVDIENQIQIYPNPFNESFEINISTRSERKNVSIQVYDLNGSKIIEKKLTVMNKTTVDFSGLNAIPAGMYFVKLKVGENIYKLKMLKQ